MPLTSEGVRSQGSSQRKVISLVLGLGILAGISLDRMMGSLSVMNSMSLSEHANEVTALHDAIARKEYAEWSQSLCTPDTKAWPLEERTFGVELELTINKDQLKTAKNYTDALLEITESMKRETGGSIDFWSSFRPKSPGVVNGHYSQWLVTRDKSIFCAESATEMVIANCVPGGFSPGTAWECEQHQSSFCYGIEIVSPVLKGEEGLEEIRTVLAAARRVGLTVLAKNGAMNPSVGFHTHVYAKDLSSASASRSLASAVLFEDVIEQTFPKSRRYEVELVDGCFHACYSKSNRHNLALGPVSDSLLFSTFVRNHSDTTAFLQDFVDDKSAHPRDHDATRRFKLNLMRFENIGTVEFRHREGSVDGDEMIKWVRLVRGIIQAGSVCTGDLSVRENVQASRADLIVRLRHFFSTLSGYETTTTKSLWGGSITTQDMLNHFEKGFGKDNPWCYRSSHDQLPKEEQEECDATTGATLWDGYTPRKSATTVVA